MTEINNELEVNPSENEITLDSLQKIINAMQEELHAKDTLLTSIIKDKERLQRDLKKYKRANHNLKQQLEDERAFYLKEKEYYCKEMFVTKRIRQEQNEELKTMEEVVEQIKENESLRTDISKLRVVLNETLEANYNLSIKFLRMKNTKYSLKAKLKREQTENAKIISDLSIKLDNTKHEINHIISDKFRMPIPPSNRKYLQIVKQNTQLIHDTLNYQVQISRLYNDIERIKADKIKSETSLRLQYARKFKVESKQSSDKICEVNMCEELTANCPPVIENKVNPSNCTISTTSKDYPLFSDTEFSQCPKKATRTQSAPEFIMRNDEITEDNENNFQYQNT